MHGWSSGHLCAMRKGPAPEKGVAACQVAVQRQNAAGICMPLSAVGTACITRHVHEACLREVGQAGGAGHACPAVQPRKGILAQQRGARGGGDAPAAFQRAACGAEEGAACPDGKSWGVRTLQCHQHRAQPITAPGQAAPPHRAPCASAARPAMYRAALPRGQARSAAAAPRTKPCTACGSGPRGCGLGCVAAGVHAAGPPSPSFVPVWWPAASPRSQDRS